MKKLISINDITLGHRIFIGIIWVIFISYLNFLFFAPFIGYKYGFLQVFLVIGLWIILYLLVKNTKYVYILDDKFLHIKTPRKKSQYKIPLEDIEKVWEFKNIPFHFKIWMKYDFFNKILFLCGYCSNWIILKLKNFDNQIVICPRKFNEFYEFLKSIIKSK